MSSCNTTVEIIESANDVYIEVGDCSILAIETEDILAITDCVGAEGNPGPPGSAGSPGPQGPAGPPGAGGLTMLTFNFATAMPTWTINHGLGTKAVTVELFESDGITEKEGEVLYLDNNTIEVIWYYSETGLARLYH